MHIIVGAILKKNEEILMIDRSKAPFGWALPGGHANDDEVPEIAVRREIFEETGLEIKKVKLLIHESSQVIVCKEGVKEHDFFVYEILDWEGDVNKNNEAKRIDWLSLEEIGKNRLEKSTKYFFEKLGIV